MKSLGILLAAALAAGNLAASETKAPPASSKGAPPPAAFAVPMRADLKVSAKPNNGIGPLFDFKIENVGNLKSREAGIQFWAMPPCQLPNGIIGSGKLLKTGTVPALVVTTSPSYAFSYSFEMPPAFRGCGIKVVVDPDHLVLEVTRDNNEVILQTHLPPAPDLVVSYWLGKFTVKNQGDANAGASVARVSCSSAAQNHPCDPQGGSNQKTWTYNVPALAPGQTFVFDSPIVHQYKDFLTAVADTNHQVPELIETNNVWTPY
jgi:hypothetical protein